MPKCKVIVSVDVIGGSPETVAAIREFAEQLHAAVVRAVEGKSGATVSAVLNSDGTRVATFESERPCAHRFRMTGGVCVSCGEGR